MRERIWLFFYLPLYVLAKPLVPSLAESLIVLKNNDLAGDWWGVSPGDPHCSLLNPGGVCTPWVGAGRSWGSPGPNATGCGECCRWQQQPAPGLRPQLNLLQTPSITSVFVTPPHRLWINMVCLHGLGAASEHTGCCTEVGRWNSTWLLTSVPGFCEAWEPSFSSSSSSEHRGGQQPSSYVAGRHGEASWPSPGGDKRKHPPFGRCCHPPLAALIASAEVTSGYPVVPHYLCASSPAMEQAVCTQAGCWR